MKYLSVPTLEKKALNVLENSNYNGSRGKMDQEVYNSNTNNYCISRGANNINIFENYIKNDNITNTNNNSLDLFNSTSHNNFPFDSKLHYQLMRKRKEMSSCYNFLLLTTFNLNISHFCFPYLLTQIGLINLIFVLLLCGFFSYLVHSGLIEYVSGNKEISNLNFADLINSHFGSFCAWYVEIGMVFWFMYNTVNFYTTCN
jgi:hypothetical protein